MEPLLTFIIPVYGIEEAFLRACIDSFVKQKSDGYRILLIDDGSPDHCGAICDEYAERYAMIKAVHQRNQGVSAARNKGICMAVTPWLTFFDADDWIEDGAVQRILEELQGEASGADIVMFDLYNETKAGTENCSLNINSGFCEGQLLQECKQGPFFKMKCRGNDTAFPIASSVNKIYRADFLREKSIRFMPGLKRGEDLLFNADAMNSTDHIYYVNYGYYHYRWNGESATNRYTPDIVEITKKEIEGLKEQIEKHQLPEETESFLNCWICTRMYSCIRLYFAHRDNPANWMTRMKELKKTVLHDPFKTAIRKAPLQYYSCQEKIFVFMLKKNWYYGCVWLVIMKAWLFKVKNIRG